MEDVKDIDLWIEHLKKKEYSYFEPFYEATKKRVFYEIYTYVSDYSEAEDILQDTYIYFLEHIHKIKKNSSPMGYLIITARHKSIDFLRKKKRLSYQDESVFQKIEYQEMSIEDVSIHKDRIEKVKALLTKEEYEILYMHVCLGMKHKEISILKGIPLGTVTWKYNEILKKCRKELEQDE